MKYHIISINYSNCLYNYMINWIILCRHHESIICHCNHWHIVTFFTWNIVRHCSNCWTTFLLISFSNENIRIDIYNCFSSMSRTVYTIIWSIVSIFESFRNNLIFIWIVGTFLTITLDHNFIILGVWLFCMAIAIQTQINFALKVHIIIF